MLYILLSLKEEFKPVPYQVLGRLFFFCGHIHMQLFLTAEQNKERIFQERMKKTSCDLFDLTDRRILV